MHNVAKAENTIKKIPQSILLNHFRNKETEN